MGWGPKKKKKTPRGRQKEFSLGGTSPARRGGWGGPGTKRKSEKPRRAQEYHCRGGHAPLAAGDVGGAPEKVLSSPGRHHRQQRQDDDQGNARVHPPAERAGAQE